MKARYLVRAISSAAALLVTTSFAGAQVSDGVVKIGVLTDMTGLYSDLSGRGSVAAAQMAVEDFGGKVMGKRIEVVAADHQNKPDVGAVSRGDGSTWSGWMRSRMSPLLRSHSPCKK